MHMKTGHYTKLKWFTFLPLLVCILGRLSAQPVLTGIGVFGTDSSGASDNSGEWNTVPSDRFVDVFLSSGSSLSGPFINGPADAGAAISLSLVPGQYTYRLFGGSGTADSYHAISLCFNGSSTPAISALAATQYSANSPPGFQANGSPLAYDLNMNLATGANSLSFQQGNTLVTLTQYSWADPTCYNVDRISAPFGSYGVIGQDGVPDWVGEITLNVTTVPEPASCSLLLMALGGIILIRASRAHSRNSRATHISVHQC